MHKSWYTSKIHDHDCIMCVIMNAVEPFSSACPINWNTPSLIPQVINFYMNLLVERSKDPNLPSVNTFNTFFYPKLRCSGYSTVRRWTKKMDIFAKDILLVPVHLGVHWCLSVSLNDHNCEAAMLRFIHLFTFFFKFSFETLSLRWWTSAKRPSCILILWEETMMKHAEYCCKLQYQTCFFEKFVGLNLTSANWLSWTIKLHRN